MISFKDLLYELPDVKLTEVALVPGQLSGKNSATGELRVDILKQLIKDNIPLKMVPGKGHKKDLFTVVDKVLALDNLDQFVRDGKAFTIGTHDGKPVLSSHIEKSKVFGGGAAEGQAGTASTAIAESAQCLWCAAYTTNPGKPIEYFTDEILSVNANTLRVFTGSTDLKTMLAISDDWKMSSYKSAKLLYDNGYINKEHSFHRDDRKMNDIYSKKKDAYTNNDLKNLNNDKWNPGDIWALASDFNADNIPTQNVRALNIYMLKQFKAKKIVGISLKKLSGKSDGKFKEYNLEVPSPTDNFKLKSLNVRSSGGTFWSSKECSITTEEGTILDLKPNKGQGSMRADIKGKGARGGSIGYGPIQDILEILKVNPTTPKNSELVKQAKLIISNDRKSAVARNDLFNRIIPYETMTKKSFDEEISKKDLQWVHAKIGALTILDAINNSTPNKKDLIVTRMINYAASKLEDSSVYIKVSN